MRERFPQIRHSVYCSECRTSVNMTRVDRDQKIYYVCMGNKHLGYAGCGFYHDHGRAEVRKENDNG